MKNRIFLISCMLIVFLGGSAIGQDFKALMDAVSRIETNLKQLVVQEAETRQQETSELKSAIAKLKKTTGNNPAGSATEEQLADVMSELTALRVEVEDLKRALSNNSKQLTSINSEGWSAADLSDDQVEQLTVKIAAINDNVEALIAHQNKPAQKSLSKSSGPKTSVNGRMFSHGRINTSDDNNSYNEFAVSRAYVTLKSKLSNYASIRITSDLRPIDDKYNIILKYAYLDWKPAFTQGRAKLRFGLQATLYIDQMNKLWGRRYMEKTVSDKRKFLTSSDLGISTIIGFGPKSKYGFFSLALLNGTSYSSVQELNSSKDINLVSLVKPFKNLPAFSKSVLMAQLYTGTQNKSLDDIMTVDTDVSPWDTTITAVESSDWKRQMFSIGGLLAWNSTLDFGFDMSFTTVGKGAELDATKKSGFSLFSTFYLKKLVNGSSFMNTVNFFGRVDFYDPNTNSSNNDETLGIFGIESVPVKGFKVALNYRMMSFEDNTRNSENNIYINTLFKF